MKAKLTLALGLVVGFLLGSKAGPKPWEWFMGLMRKLRHTKLVSRPIESAADQASRFVRRKGIEMTDKAADAVHRKIVGSHPVVIEARVQDEVHAN